MELLSLDTLFKLKTAINILMKISDTIC